MFDTPGLKKRGAIWHIDKTVRVGRHRVQLRESTGCSESSAAKAVLLRRIAEVQAQLLEGPQVQEHTFAEAAIQYVLDLEDRGKSSVRAAYALQSLDEAILNLPLSHIHQGTLKPWIDRQKGTLASGTVSRTLRTVSTVLHFAAEVLRDEHAPWLKAAPPKLRAPDWGARRPVRLTWEEQSKLVAVLPAHLVGPVEFALATGARQEEIVSLRWDQHYPVSDIPEWGVWWIPPEIRKGSARRAASAQQGRYLIANAAARAVVARQTRISPWVFPSTRHDPVDTRRRLYRINNSGWESALAAAGLKMRVHDLRHTFGERAADAGIPLDIRRSLLGHEHRDITLHYSSPGLVRLMAEAERIVRPAPKLVVVAAEARAA